MQRAWRLIMALREWMFTHPCTSHCGNVLLKLIAAIPEVSAMLEEALEINAQFAGPHHQKSLLKKHSPDHNEGVALSVMRPCDSRFGLNFLVVLRLIRLQAALASCCADATWDAKLGTDSDSARVKERINHKPWWENTTAIMRIVYPMCLIVKMGGFNQGSLSKLYPQMKKAEALWSAASTGTEGIQKKISTAILEIIGENEVEDDDGDDQNRWQMMKSDLAVCAYVMDPMFFEQKVRRKLRRRTDATYHTCAPMAAMVRSDCKAGFRSCLRENSWLQ